MTAVTAKSLEVWLISRLAEVRGIDPQSIDVRERFSRYGLDSLGATRLVAELSTLVDRALSPTLVWEHTTIEALARHLTGEPDRDRGATAEVLQQRDAREPIAIVGMACRFPGAPDIDAFWRLLADGVDAITEVPRDRWDAASIFDPDVSAPGKVNTRWGGFLDQVDRFDPQFFGVSPREATQMDPQQRLALELAWEALEDAGIPPPHLAESRTGVFLGALFTDYALLQDRAGREAITTHSSTGGAACIIANRVSYALALQGPSLTVDTACSSSLVAVHLASQSLRSGESDVALAGGVNLMLVPETTMGFSRLGAMSPDGRSRAFGAGANGYVRSEGGGVVVLKRLSDALRAGDPIYAVVRGSAINNDGASNGLTAPNPKAQQAVLRDACRSADLAPGDVHYVEAHGTGTPLGDPIEASGLGAVYGVARGAGESLLIGSAKTNVGHLEAAAGVVGLVKVALAMKHDLLPPSLHFDQPNPHIDFEGLHLQVVQSLRPWPTPEGAPRRAGVSSFGYGGTNSHVILESMPRSTQQRGPIAQVDRAPAAQPRRVVWVFSGQGSQWVGMGRALVLGEPAFRSALERCDRALRPLLGWSVFDEILRGAPRAVPDRIDVMWPTLFAFQVALAGLLRSLGAAPAAVIGHSIGEVAAAHVAGALSLEDAARVIAAQAKLVQGKVGVGAMLIAAVGWEEAQELAAASGGRVTCAISASPVATVFAGEAGPLAELSGALAARGVFVRPIGTSAAVHGPQMAFLVDELPAPLAGIAPRRGEIPIISGMTGEMRPGEGFDATYWARQLHEPVRFAQGTTRLLADGHELFVEVSPHPIVKQSIEESIRYRGARATVVPTLVRGEDEVRSLREVLGVLSVHGVPEAAVSPRLDRVYVLPVSGQVDAARREAAGRLADLLERGEGPSLDDVCYTASVRRPHHRVRGVVVARDRVEMGEGLRALAEGREHASVRTGAASMGGASKVVFVFSGQGSQWVGMGRRLLVEEPVFRASVEECDALLRRHVSWSLLEALAAPEGQSRLGETEVVQPALFAVQVGIAELLRSWGVTPDAVIGHSVGEVAAAHVAGALSLDEAVRLVAWRGRIMQRATGLGKMTWVMLPMEAAAAAIAGREADLAIAAINDPGSVVLSGDTVALDEVVATLSERGVECRALKVNYAFHSPQMDPLVHDLKDALGRVETSRATLALYSTVNGAAIDGEVLDATYWGRNVREPVQLARAMGAAFGDGHRLFLEVGPHPVLSANLEQCLAAQGKEGHVVSTLRRQSDERVALLKALGNLFTKGLDVDWPRLYPQGGRSVSLPAYPWQRERYWLDGGTAERAVPAAPRDPLDDCVYEVQWQKKARAAASAPTPGGAWLVFADRGGLGGTLAARLASRGQSTVRVVCGKRFARVEPDLYEIDPARADDYVAVLREAFGKGRVCRGFVHLSSLDATPMEQATAETLESDQHIAFLSALRAVQAILRTSWRDKPRVFLVTQGAQAVGSERVVGVAQAPLWGLGRTLALEHPELDCTLVDLDPAPGNQGADDLLGEISAPDAETQVALRGGARHVARMVRSRFDAATAREFRFHEGASYLVTGGLGGLGLSVAAWMVEQGARHVALVGRRAPTEEAQAVIRTMEADGAEVIVLSADVSKRSDVEHALAEITRRMPALRGVVHAAGIVQEPSSVSQLEEDAFWPVMAPKMLGAFHLHTATRDTPLDFFALYSSASALLGLIGQAVYAAANATLDAIAQGRCSVGLAGQSVLWGPFSDAGLAARGGLGDRMGRGGLASLTPEQGCDALGRLLARHRAQVAVMSFSIRQWLDIFPQLAVSPFWSELRQGDAGPQAAGPSAGRFRQLLEAAAPVERLGLLEQHVREHVGQVLQIDSARIERLAPFKTLGVDSLMSLEVRNRLEASLGLRLPTTLLFTYTSVALLAEHVRQLVDPSSESAVVESRAQAPIEEPRDLDPAGGDDDLLAAFEASARRIKKGFLS